MTAAKWIIVGPLGAAAFGAIGYAVLRAPEPRPALALATVPHVELRPFQGSPTAVSAPVKPVPRAPAPDAGASLPSPDAGKPDASAPGLDAGKVGPDGGTALGPGTAKAAADGGKPATDGGAAATTPPQPPAPRRPPPVGEAIINMRASDTADVYLDGKKIGTSPMMEVKVKSGPHKVRFDCYDAAGNTTPGTVQTVVLGIDENRIVEFTCPTSE